MARDKTELTDKTHRGFNLSTFDVLLHAEMGDTRPLAKHIASGGHICNGIRSFLAAHLIGEKKTPPGNRRTWAQINREMRIVGVVRDLTRVHGSEYKAIREYCELHPEMNIETLRGYLRKAKKRSDGRRVRKP